MFNESYRKMWIKNILIPIFIFEYAIIHHVSSVKLTLKENEVLFVYLSLYYNFLSIKKCFSKWKNYVIKGGAKDESGLD